MAFPPEENASNWVFDCGLLENLPTLDASLAWTNPHNALPPPTSLSVEFDDLFGDSDCRKKHGSRKRLRSGACGASDSKAYKEKMRRDRLKDTFQELSSILEPGKPPKTDKTVILNDAVRMVIQLREEAQKLKESFGDLQGKVTELKKEKSELRDEKMKLKAEKEKLEQQVKALSTRPGFLPHMPPIPSSFAAPPQVIGSKLVPVLGFPGVPMWQLMPPTATDTSEDHTFHPPVA